MGGRGFVSAAIAVDYDSFNETRSFRLWAVARLRGLFLCLPFDPGVALRFTTGFMLTPASQVPRQNQDPNTKLAAKFQAIQNELANPFSRIAVIPPIQISIIRLTVSLK